MSYANVPQWLRRFDKKLDAQVPEAVLTQLVWCCIANLPHLSRLLRLPPGLKWWAGRHGEGDLTGRDDGSVMVHLEVKSSGAAASWGSRCPHGCGEYRSQLTHMAEDSGATIVVVCQTGRAGRVQKMVSEAEVPDERVRIVTFAELADAVEGALRQGGAPRHDLVAALLDVEPPDDGTEAA